jgi:hypothetical protein
MPIEAAAKRLISIASVRVLRLAFGTAASLWFSQAVAWDMSFIAPVMTIFLLALPLPAPKFKAGLGLVLALVLSMLAGLALLPRIINQPMVGLLLLMLALYWSFYFTAKGGSAALGTLLTVGIAMATAVGTVSVDALLLVVKGVSFGAVAGVVFVWIAHALVPDSLSRDGPASAPPKQALASPPDLFAARWNAFRSLMIVLPVALWFLFSSASASFMPVMIKVASMGQQASNDATRVAGRSLIMSTVIGGIGAIIGWQVLRITPTLSVYTLVIALAGLFAGPRIFSGKGMQPDGGTWSYAYLTMIVILAPAVMDSAGGDAAGAKFLERIIMFVLTTLYAVVAVYVFDAFRPQPKKSN